MLVDLQPEPRRVYLFNSPLNPLPLYLPSLKITSGEQTKSKFTSALKNRNDLKLTAPLPTWEPMVATSISMLRVLLGTFKTNILLSKWIATGYIATTPAHPATKIEKVKINVDPNISIRGIKSIKSPMIHAEWVDFDRGCETAEAERVILFLHGGAYVIASRRTHRAITWRLSKYAHARVLDYRLSPEETFPIPMIDVLSCYKYLLYYDDGTPRYKPSQISFVGDSAGGGLAIACALYCRDTGLFPMPGAIGSFSPWMDLTLSLPSWRLNDQCCYVPSAFEDPKHTSETRTNMYVSHDSLLQDPYVSPCYAEETRVNLPPILIHVGGAERVRDDSLYFVHKFANSFIKLEIYEEMVHMFQLFSPYSDFSKLSISRLGSFIYENTGKEPCAEFCREMLWIRNEVGFPVESIDTNMGCAQVLSEGIQMVIENGQYKETVDSDGISTIYTKINQ